MTIGERIKTLRKNQQLNQSEFGERIGVKYSTVGLWENGQRSVSDAIIILICEKYGVSEDWLRTGNGGMFVHNEQSELARLASEYALDAMDCKIIESYMRLSKFQRQAIKSFILDVAEQEAAPATYEKGETTTIAAMGDGLKVVDKNKAKRDLYSGK